MIFSNFVVMEELKKNKNMKAVWVAVFVIIFVVVVCSNLFDKTKQYKMCSGVVWTTQYNITYECEKELDDSIQSIFRAVDGSLSMFNKNSLISRINNGEKLRVDTMLSYLYKTSVKVNEETQGAFDPTVSPLMKMWGFVNGNGVLPDSSQVDSIKAFVGLEKTALEDGYIVKKDSRTSFDFSAIAKGFACDEIGRMLKRNGVSNYLVEIGGEITVEGKNHSGDKWRIAVDKPIESNDSVLHESVIIVELNKGGVATSGNYRNYKSVEGRKVVHTMNPLTGYPEQSNLLSVSIIAENCMLADAYATACMVLGTEMVKNTFEKSKEIGVLLIYMNENGIMSLWSNERFDSFVKQ